MVSVSLFPKALLVYAIAALSVCALLLQSVPQASAQYVDEAGILHLGAPEDKGDDKGKPPPPKQPPEVPKSGPGTMLAIALLGGAGYWTMRRSMSTQSFTIEKQ